MNFTILDEKLVVYDGETEITYCDINYATLWLQKINEKHIAIMPIYIV